MSDQPEDAKAGMLSTEPSEAEEDEEELEEEPAEAPTTQMRAVVPEIETPPTPPRVRKIDFVSKRNWYFLFSLLIIIPGIFFMAHSGFKLGIDFAGGTEFTVNFPSRPSQAQVEAAVASENAGGSVISTGNGGYIIRTLPLTPALQRGFEDDIRSKVGPYDLQQVLEVGGTIAGETIRLALFSVFLAAIVILGLLTFWFRNVPGGWRAGFQFGGSALAALLHDVFLLTGVFAILGTGLNLRIGEINSLFVTAVLTVVGFSVHDTIVVFDRIRENLRVSQRLSFEQVVNISIMQTLVRSIITSFTVVLVLVAILVSGGDTLKGFALALLIGIVSGTYSSIFNAAPLLVVWRRLQPLR
ncbi:MAG: protein translocase subunit SecF [Chloroflexi bacterium]|nr:MAG: protein translocase subunit SecF [Chloroflexota bacterium]